MAVTLQSQLPPSRHCVIGIMIFIFWLGERGMKWSWCMKDPWTTTPTRDHIQDPTTSQLPLPTSMFDCKRSRGFKISLYIYISASTSSLLIHYILGWLLAFQSISMLICLYPLRWNHDTLLNMTGLRSLKNLILHRCAAWQ